MLSDILSGNLKKSGKAFVPDGTSQLIEAVSQRRSVKKEFLEFRKIHRKTPMPGSLF